MDSGQRDILCFQVQRTISSLCKNVLNILEDLQEEYDRYLVEDNNVHGEMADRFLDNQHFDHLRKRILDRGGDATRDLLEELNKYKVKLLTNEELQEQAEGKI